MDTDSIITPPGEIVGFDGNMTGGKTTGLTGSARGLRASNVPLEFFEPASANRYGTGVVQSHIGANYQGARQINEPKDILRLAGDAPNLFFDEVHFWEIKPKWAKDFLQIVLDFNAAGRNIYWAGLQFDFRREPFRLTGELMNRSHRLMHLIPPCKRCGQLGVFPQRLIFGQPAWVGHPRFVPDTAHYRNQGITYEARCRTCHVLTTRPNEHLRAIFKALQSSSRQKPNHR